MAEAIGGLQDMALTWSGRALDVARIESELGKLRYMAAGEPAGGEAFALRTSLLNMVVYAEHEDRADHASRVIEDLASHHPSRALILVATPSDEESHVEAQLAAHCHIAREYEQTVCCEEVSLKVSGGAARHLHSIVAPLLVPDLPVYVWWTEPLPAEVHEFRELFELSDRLIVDSSRFPDGLAGLKLLSRLAEEVPSAAVGDLTWARLDLWRRLLKRQRQVQEVRHHLDCVTSVEVRYASGKVATAEGGQGLLFLGWLAGELGWDLSTAAGSGGGDITLNGTDGSPVTLYVRPVDYAAVDPGSLVSLKIVCRADGSKALVSISRTGDPYHLTIRTEHKGQVSEGHMRAEPDQPADVLMRELDVAAHDSEFTIVLRNTARLIDCL